MNLRFWRRDEIPVVELQRYNPIRVGVIALVVAAILVYFGFTKAIPFKHGYRLKAEFATAVNIHPKSPVRIALENTAGQGTCLGAKIAHIAAIYDRVKKPERLGICLDTAHFFAAGYDIYRYHPPIGHCKLYPIADHGFLALMILSFPRGEKCW